MLIGCKNNEKPSTTKQIDTTSVSPQDIDTFSNQIIPNGLNVTIADSVTEFVPNDFNIFERIYGDLNNDSIEDCILIVKATDTSKYFNDEFRGKLDRNRRGLIILFKKNNQYELALKNLQCFYSEHEDGGVYYAPELSIEIRNSKLYVNFLHGRYGYWGYTFRYQNNNFELIGYDSESLQNTAVSDITSINFLTCTKIYKNNTNDFCESGEEIFKTTTTKFRKTSIPNLAQISDFESYGDYVYNASK